MTTNATSTKRYKELSILTGALHLSLWYFDAVQTESFNAEQGYLIMTNTNGSFEDFTDFKDWNGWKSDGKCVLLKIKDATFVESDNEVHALPTIRVTKEFESLPQAAAYEVSFTYQCPTTMSLFVSYDGNDRGREELPQSKHFLKEHKFSVAAGLLQSELTITLYAAANCLKMGEIRVRQTTRNDVDDLEINN